LAAHAVIDQRPKARDGCGKLHAVPGSKTDKRKQSLYFQDGMLAEIIAEAHRLDRSMSWVVQRAWEIARKEIKKMKAE
jgi:uncharacterized small protein (TIGR04563 family)